MTVMTLAQQILFAIVVLSAVVIIRRRVVHLRKGILLGRSIAIRDRKAERWRNVMLVAFGQRKMFKRPIPALLHLFVYVGFLIINIEVLEFMIDGIAGTHRIFAPYLGTFYHVLMNMFEFLAVAVLISCLIFLVRRNVLRLRRFWSSEMTSWPRLDANLILLTEIALMLAILTMNAADQLLQAAHHPHYTLTGSIFFSSFLMPLFDHVSVARLAVIERVAWWFHILGILGFAVYITYSKHLHIALAFPNTYYARLSSRGKMENMPVVTNEVRSMLGMASAETGSQQPAARFGAKDVTDLSWKHLMDAYACTECGRCTSECPANLTGKKLSPRKIMMDVRDRVEEKVRQPGEEGRTLLDTYISREEINACTSCNACVEACPVLINPLDIILELRRYVAMEESGSPASWNMMFQNIETSFAPWKFAPSERFNWAGDRKA